MAQEPGLAAPYAIAAAYCADLLEAGGSDWLNLLVLLLVWDTLKFVLIGPISLLKLIAARVREAVARRRMKRALLSDGVERFDEPALVSLHC
ncbi:hypothetical protein [Cryobacterium gelidum]|uniref:Uncharacterized protein n=1 Tax=Cryobacterium gelidum TaxID=1259164 RepID=A0A4R9ASB3_9MICO|nr:hypothetical protein [Cryobacterium gelidum]TFD68172.1 hypothetical protein E3T50_13390 [Cryobacterium gelidum]